MRTRTPPQAAEGGTMPGRGHGEIEGCLRLPRRPASREQRQPGANEMLSAIDEGRVNRAAVEAWPGKSGCSCALTADSLLCCHMLALTPGSISRMAEGSASRAWRMEFSH